MSQDAVVALQQRREDLRREELLSREALAAPGVSREQRAIHQTLLRDVRRRSADLGRQTAAVEAGWMPFRPSQEWYAGLLGDPRLLGGHSRPLAVAAAVVLALAPALPVARAADAGAASALLLAAVIALGSFAILRQLLGAIDRRREDLAQANLAAISGRAVQPLLIFNAPMPRAALLALQEARGSGLFDGFLVCSPRLEDFRQLSLTAVPTLGLLDPVLIGLIGGDSFLVARWDLAEDLKLA